MVRVPKLPHSQIRRDAGDAIPMQLSTLGRILALDALSLIGSALPILADRSGPRPSGVMRQERVARSTTRLCPAAF